MTTIIGSKIVGYEVVTKDEPVTPAPVKKARRPQCLSGVTYVLSPPSDVHGLSVTINDDEEGNPYEIFLYSSNPIHYQWTTALTRVISAAFRRGGDLSFIAEELVSVHSPGGGYFSGQQYMPSLVAEVGRTLEAHLTRSLESIAEGETPDSETFPEHATVCTKCMVKAVVVLDGCAVCLSCHDSKCG